MILELLASAAEIGLVVAGLYLALRVYMRRKQSSWPQPAEKRRLALLLVLVLAVMALKVGESVVAGGSGPIDKELLMFVHAHLSGGWIPVFEAITFTGSYKVMYPLAIAVIITLMCIGKRREALLVTISIISGATVVYLIKGAVGRDRPALWQTEWYWGSSFPSGHTLAVATFATALVICVKRLWPAWHLVALWTAFAWIGLVGLSRLVLGVHWPSDVLAAACIGACLPLAASFALELKRV